jgi:enoyl-CoA hydratase/carnithine racemase
MPHELSFREDRRVAEIVITAPSRNALNRAGIDELYDMLDDLATNDEIRAVILSGAGENFCAGRLRNMELRTKAEIATDLTPILSMNELIDSYPVPLIAAVEGAALGFGFGLATLCDVTIAADDATFALTELAHGIPPLIVLSYFFKFLPYKVGFDLALTGRELGAEQAREFGLVTTTCAKGATLATARELASTVAGVSPEAVRLLRRFARDTAGIVDSSTAAHGADLIADLLEKATR